MKKIFAGIAALSLVAALAWRFFLNAPTEEDRVRDALNAMVAACSKKSGETAVAMALKNSETSNMIADICSVSINEAMVDGTFKPLELAGQIGRARTLFTSLSGSISDLHVKIAPNGETADAEYSIRVSGVRKKDGERFDESRDLRSKLVKVDGEWKFASFEITAVLER